jgi:hypothetical protein
MATKFMELLVKKNILQVIKIINPFKQLSSKNTE